MQKWVTVMVIGGLAAGCMGAPTPLTIKQVSPGQRVASPSQSADPSATMPQQIGAGQAGLAAGGATSGTRFLGPPVYDPSWSPDDQDWPARIGTALPWSVIDWQDFRWPRRRPGDRPTRPHWPTPGWPTPGYPTPHWPTPGWPTPGYPTPGPDFPPQDVDPGIVTEFRSLDANRDGVVSRWEYIEGKMAQIRYFRAPTDEEIAQHRASIAVDFAKSDRNGNGYLTLYEYANAPIYHIL